MAGPLAFLATLALTAAAWALVAAEACCGAVYGGI